MKMFCSRAARRGVTALIAAALLATTGCGDPAEEEEPISVVEEEAASMFPIMLHNKTIRHKSYSFRLQFTNISEVELHELSEKAPDGTYTAVISFLLESRGQPYKVNLSVKYKQLVETNDAGIEVLSYPLSELKTLSVERVS